MNELIYDRVSPAQVGNIPESLQEAFGGDSGCEVALEGELVGYVPNFPSEIGDEVEGIALDGSPMYIVG